MSKAPLYVGAEECGDQLKKYRGEQICWHDEYVTLKRDFFQVYEGRAQDVGYPPRRVSAPDVRHKMREHILAVKVSEDDD